MTFPWRPSHALCGGAWVPGCRGDFSPAPLLPCSSAQKLASGIATPLAPWNILQDSLLRKTAYSTGLAGALIPRVPAPSCGTPEHPGPHSVSRYLVSWGLFLLLSVI